MSRLNFNKRSVTALAGALVLAAALPLAGAWAHHPELETDDPNHEHAHGVFELHDPSAALAERDAARARIEADGDVVSSGPFARKSKNLELVSRGVRLEENATTDVWALDGFAYTGTFNSPCGGEPGAGIHVWDVRKRKKVNLVGVIDSPVGSRSNDVKAANMNSGAILVHSNEACNGGPGGFEVYNVDDPTNPVHLAHVQVDEIAEISPLFFAPGALEDNGVHNLWLFTQGDRDYVAAQSEGVFDGFQIFEITDPANPVLVSGWGAEEVFDPGVGALTLAEDPTGARTLDAINWMFDGFGASTNRFLHDFTITPDGQRAYLAHWDAGLILLDISDPANPQLVSVALDPTSEDGEVNSHSVWFSGDETIVVEGEEDFAPFTTVFRITSGPAAGEVPAAEGGFTTPINSLPGEEMAGPTVYVGFACTTSTNPDQNLAVPAADPGQIALIQRGGCRFDEKATSVINANYAGMVVFNNAGEDFFPMGGNPRDIPGVMVGNSTGLTIAGVASAADLVIGDLGESVAATVEPDGWSGLRVWDYSDPANPVLASTFNTVCSADPVDPSCDVRGTYSSHNLIVEDHGNKVKAYISWYSDGVLILDVSDPYNPEETARFHEEGAEFEAANGGIQDVWGIYKVPGKKDIYASDRNGGLYILREKGSLKVAGN